MGAYLISVPDFSDTDLIFDESETRVILKFFYPGDFAAINNLIIGNEARQLAQTMLVGAIDGSYGIGFIEALVRSLTRPSHDIRNLAKKLARRFFRHWYKYATQSDLEEVKIYDAVRIAIANSLRSRFRELLSQDVSSLQRRRSGLIMYVTANRRISSIWA